MTPLEEAKRHLTAGKPDKALRLLEEALRRNPDDEEIRVEFEYAMEAAGRYVSLLSTYQREQRSRPKDPRWIHRLARVEESVPELRSLVDRGLQLLPAEPGFGYLKALLEADELAAHGRYEEALERVPKAAPTGQDAAAHEVFLGGIYLQKGDAKRGEEQALKALRVRPYSLEAHYLLIRAHDDRNDIASASKAAQAAKRLTPAEWPIAYLGSLSWADGKTEKAMRLMKAALASPRSKNGWGWKAMILASNGKVKEAEDAYRQARRLRPDDPGLLFVLGGFYWGQGKMAELEEVSAALQALNPSGREAAMVSGYFHCGQNRFKEGVESFKRAHALNKDDVWAAVYGSYCLSQEKPRAWDVEAAMALHRATEALPRHPDLLRTVGITYDNFGNHELSGQNFSKLSALLPKDYSNWMWLAHAAEVIGDNEGARRAYGRAHKLAASPQQREEVKEALDSISMAASGRVSDEAPKLLRPKFKRIRKYQSGGLLSYVKDGGLYVGRPWLGLERRIYAFRGPHSEEHVWAPSGKHIYLAAEGGIVSVNLSDFQSKVIAQIPQNLDKDGTPLDFASLAKSADAMEIMEKVYYQFFEILGVSLDGAEIYYLARVVPPQRPGVEWINQYRLESIAPDGTGKRLIHAFPAGVAFSDFQPAAGLVTVTFDTGEVRVIDVHSGTAKSVATSSSGIRFHSISPRGGVLSFADENGPRGKPTGLDAEIVTVALADGALTRTGLVGGGPAWDSSGDRLLYWYEGTGVRVFSPKQRELVELRAPAPAEANRGYFWGETAWTSGGRFVLVNPGGGSRWGDTPADQSLGTAIFDLEQRTVWYAEHFLNKAVWAPVEDLPGLSFEPVSGQTRKSAVKDRLEEPQFIEIEGREDILPAIFLGAIQTWNRHPDAYDAVPLKRSALRSAPKWLNAIAHKHSGNAVSWARGVGLLIPLKGSSFDRGLVEILRTFSSEGDYFGYPMEENEKWQAALMEAKDDRSRMDVYRRQRKATFDFQMSKVEEKYPDLKGLGPDFFPTHEACLTSDSIDADGRDGLNRLFARFGKLPPVSEGSMEALLVLGAENEMSFVGWDCLADLGSKKKVKVTPEMLRELSKRLEGHRVGAYLLWENSD